MKKKIVTFKGITRSTDDTISVDGECMELINARIKNGSVTPVGRPILEKALSNGQKPIFIHKNGSYEHVISYVTINGVGRLIYDYDRSLETYTPVNSGLSIELSEQPTLQSIGNTLIIVTSTDIYYALFKDGEYKVLGNKPVFPTMVFSADSVSQNIQYSSYVECDINPTMVIPKAGDYVTMVDANVKLVNDSVNGTLAKYIYDAKDSNEFCYPVVLRYALRMYDGSYILHSAPILLRTENKFKITVSTYNTTDGKLTDFKYHLGTIPFRITLQCNLQSALADWKDIITSVDVFVSKQIPYIKNKNITAIGGSSNPTNITLDFNMFSDSEMIQKIIDTTNFYKYASVPVDSTNYVYSKVIGSALDLDNIEQKESLTDDAFTHNTITGKCSYVYNGRLHLGNIYTKLSPMLNMGIFQYHAAQVGLTEVVTEIYIKTENGTKIVRGTGYIDTSFGIIPYISYPDSRAYKLVIAYPAANPTSYKSFDLKAHDLLNTAYTFEQYTDYKTSDFVSGNYTLATVDDTEVSPTKIKVSEINNPFYFPSKNTYTVSNSSIIALAAVTTALSSGQFGQFPLYVFSDDGVYAMSVGTDVLYTVTHPISRDCCTNKYSICSTDSSVVFSTGRGLMMISGSNVQKLSEKIEGFLSSCIDSSPIIGKVAAVSGSTSILSTTEFVYYLENAKVGFCYGDKEIIVSNPAYGYSYVLGLETGEWHKISCKIDSFLNSYPDSLAIFSDGGMYNMFNQHRSVNNITLLTRPMKFDTLAYKRILQSAIRGAIRPSQSDVYYKGENVKRGDSSLKFDDVCIFSNCGFYILGSNDAEHFKLLIGREKLSDVRDLITKMNKTNAMKYFMVCLVGGVRSDVSLNYVEVIIDETYESRLH